jgi:hypothetical protein
MARIARGAAACWVVLAVSACGQPAPIIESGPGNAARLLREEIDVSLSHVPLRRAVAAILGEAPLTVAIDPEALGSSVDGKSEPEVSLTLPHLTRQSAFNLVLRPLHLRAVLRDDVLRVLPESKAEQIQEARFYPLAESVSPEDRNSLLNLVKAIVFPPDAEKRVPKLERSQSPARLVPGGLVARHTLTGHEHLARLLNRLNQIASAGLQAPLPAAAADPVTDANEALEAKLAEQGTFQTRDAPLGTALREWSAAGGIPLWINPAIQADLSQKVSANIFDGP